MHEALFKLMKESILEGDNEAAEELAQKSLEESIAPLDAINEGFMPGIDFVGEQFSAGVMFLPELVMAGEAMKSALAILEPEMAKVGLQRDVYGTCVIATVKGDIHDIGKTLVGIMLAANGFKVFDLGADVSVEEIIAKVREVGADLVGLSALLTTTMVYQRTILKELEAQGLRSQVKVIVGGAPVSKGWSEEIGADGYSEDAIGAVRAAKLVLGVSG